MNANVNEIQLVPKYPKVCINMLQNKYQKFEDFGKFCVTCGYLGSYNV